MNTHHPELIGEYEPLPEPDAWRCQACRADGDGSATVLDRAKHTAWHNRHLAAPRERLNGMLQLGEDRPAGLG